MIVVDYVIIFGAVLEAYSNTNQIKIAEIYNE